MKGFEKSAIRTSYRVGIFVDSLNIFCACRDRWGLVISHARLMQVALAGHELYRAIVYAVRFGDGMDKWVKTVKQYGFEVREKTPVRQSDGHMKADWDTDIIVDVWRMLDNIDMVVLATGDGDFCSLVQRCKEAGKIVRIIGVEGFTSKCLKEAADEFIPVTEDMLLSAKGQREQFGTSLGDVLRQAGLTTKGA